MITVGKDIVLENAKDLNLDGVVELLATADEPKAIRDQLVTVWQTVRDATGNDGHEGTDDLTLGMFLLGRLIGAVDAMENTDGRQLMLM